MRWLIGLVLMLALIWCGWWFIGSRALERGAEAWFVEQTAAGRIAVREGLSVHGFPNRFDLTVTAPELYDPATGMGWSAPFLQVLALSYRPTHVIVAFPPGQKIRTPLQDLTLTAAKLQASAALAIGRPLGINRMSLVGDEVGLASTLGWATSAQTLRFATKGLSADGLEHEIGLEVLDLVPDARVTAALPDLPATVSKLRLNAIVGLTLPAVPGGTDPHLNAIELKEMRLAWGDFGISGAGRIAAGAGGIAEGRIAFRITNWRRLLPLAVAMGVVRPEVLPTWERALSLLAAQSGDPAVLDLPLTLRRGRMSLGPLPLGPAPRLN